MVTEQTKNSILNNVSAGLDHFDPFQGFVDDGKTLNVRYGFRLGEIKFLINQFSMSEVVMNPVIYSLPNTPSWIQGLINLRGILVPVFNIKKYIDQNNDDNNSTTLLIIDKGEQAFATFIDALPDSINIDEVNLKQTATPGNAPENLKAYITDTYELNNEIWFELDFDAFIKNMTRDYSDAESD